MSKYPTCQCPPAKYRYFLKRYRNGTYHLFRQCENCRKTAQNPMKQAEYCPQWIDSLPIQEGPNQ